jgi:phosphoribosylglycinamide formyltransferase 1
MIPADSERISEKLQIELHSAPLPPKLGGSENSKSPNLGDLGGECSVMETSQVSPEACLCSPAPANKIAELPNPLKLGVLASGSGSNFEAIAQAIAQRRLPAQVKVLIYNNPDATVVQRAERYGTPTCLLNHRDYPSREALDQAIVEVLQGYGVELVVMAGWMRVITPMLLNAFPKVLNIHPSLLPSFKGIRAVEQAISAGVKIAGCTVHWVVSEVDSGEILIQAAVPVLPSDTATSLHARIQVQEHRIIVEAIGQVAEQVAERVAEHQGVNLRI